MGNGIEYNTIHVSEDSDDEDPDDFTQNEEDEEHGDEDERNTQLIMGADGQMTIGKKRKGRPSVELDLGQDFAQNDDEEEEGDDDLDAPDEGDEENGTENDSQSVASSETSVATSTATSGASNATAGGSQKSGNRKPRKNKKKRNRGRKGGRKQKGKSAKEDKEWAKYVFVQQLRLQQQHNDEINRVKTLWKQERQVRVEMHKKVLKNLKESKKKIEQQNVEIERLTKTAKIGASSDEKLSAQFKEEIVKLQAENE